jgi:uncharacterized protein YegL
MLILILLMLAGFLAAAALMVCVAQIQLARTELRASTDAAAKGAAEALLRTQSTAAAIARGQELAALNLVQGDSLQLRAADFSFGRAVADARTGAYGFVAGGTPFNSVRVSGRRTADSASGPIPLFLGNILGVGTFEPAQTVTATYIDRDVILVVDRSGSMFGRKFLELALAIDTFVDTLQTTQMEEYVGLASYSSSATADLALTQDLNLLAATVRSMPVRGATSISAGMIAGRGLVARGRSRDFVERTMIVMTDGNHNTGAEPRGIARVLADDGVVIHTVTFGADADQRRMREIAAIGRGRFFHAANGAELREVYREIALTLSTQLTQ